MTPQGGRIIKCGHIADYNTVEAERYQAKNTSMLEEKKITANNFLVFQSVHV